MASCFYGKIDTNGNIVTRNSIVGGSININDRFTVSPTGDVVCEHINIRGGSLVMGGTVITEGAWGKLTAVGAYLDETSEYHGELNAGQIKTGFIDAERIEARSINAGHIESVSLEAVRAHVDYLSALSANLGTVTAGKIQGVEIDGCTIRGGKYYDLAGEGYLQLGGSYLGDLILYSKYGKMSFKVEDFGDGVRMGTQEEWFLHAGNGIRNMFGFWQYKNFEVATSDDIKKLQSQIDALKK